MITLPYALRNLRHLYEQMLTSTIGSQPAAAKGLLGPAIEAVEILVKNLKEDFAEAVKMYDAAITSRNETRRELLLTRVANNERINDLKREIADLKRERDEVQDIDDYTC